MYVYVCVGTQVRVFSHHLCIDSYINSTDIFILQLKTLLIGECYYSITVLYRRQTVSQILVSET